jgi:hypothetical protein
MQGTLLRTAFQPTVSLERPHEWLGFMFWVTIKLTPLRSGNLKTHERRHTGER